MEGGSEGGRDREREMEREICFYSLNSETHKYHSKPSNSLTFPLIYVHVYK